MGMTMKRFRSLIGVGLLLAFAAQAKTFSTPEEAKDALIQAASQGLDAVKDLFGPESAALLRTGDAVEDKAVLTRFNVLAAEKAELESDESTPDRRTLVLGKIEWPFAIPLTRSKGGWSWDLNEGKAEIRRRTIGGNELDAMDICRGYV